MKGSYRELVDELQSLLKVDIEVSLSLLIGPWADTNIVWKMVRGKEKGGKMGEPPDPWSIIVKRSTELSQRYRNFISSLKAMGSQLGAIMKSYRAKTRLLVGGGITGWEVNMVQMLKPHDVPWIPGSSLKGALEYVALKKLVKKMQEEGLTWKDIVREESLMKLKDRKSGEYRLWLYKGLELEDILWNELRNIAKIFGTKSSKGAMSVLGGFLTRPPAYGFLTLDVLTPHYKPYYEGREDLPHEYFDPVPVKFPAVREGSEFLFIIALDSADGSLRNYVEVLLDETLTKAGIGGKTTTGYGLFERV